MLKQCRTNRCFGYIVNKCVIEKADALLSIARSQHLNEITFTPLKLDIYMLTEGINSVLGDTMVRATSAIKFRNYQKQITIYV